MEEGEGQLEGAREDKGELLRVLPFVLCAAIAALLFGYHLGVVNAALQPLSLELGVASSAAQGLVVSLLLLGACVGSFVGGSLADALGRREALRLACLPLCLGALACGAASSPAGIFAGRLLTGAGLGVTSAVTPLYISEVSPPAHRGLLGCANQVSICLGILLSQLAGLALGWRAMFLAAALPAVALFVLGRALPETPAWLARAGRRAEAAAAAQRLWGAQAEARGGEAAEAPAGAAAAAAWADLVVPEQRRATALAVGLFVVQQFSGVNAVVFFSNSVFRSAGVASDTLASAAVGLVNVLATSAAAPSLDARGRRPLLLLSFLGMAASMGALAAALSLPALAPLAVPLSVGGTLAYIAAFAAGVGPVPSLLVAELFPPALRGKGQSAAMLSHWLCAIAIGQCFLPAVQLAGVGAVYAFFGLVCLLGAFVVARYVPETKGKTYAQVAAFLQGSPAA